METSIFIAKILGPCCVIVALGILLNQKVYTKVIEDFCKNAALVYLGGIMALIIGIVVVLAHNVWVASWPVIITVYGWGGIIKGVWLIVFPNTMSQFMQMYQKKAAFLVTHSVLVLIIGASLTFFGYFA